MLINVENLSITLKKITPKKFFPIFWEILSLGFTVSELLFIKKLETPPLEHPFFGHILTVGFRLENHLRKAEPSQNISLNNNVAKRCLLFKAWSP